MLIGLIFFAREALYFSDILVASFIEFHSFIHHVHTIYLYMAGWSWQVISAAACLFVWITAYTACWYCSSLGVTLEWLWGIAIEFTDQRFSHMATKIWSCLKENIAGYIFQIILSLASFHEANDKMIWNMWWYAAFTLNGVWSVAYFSLYSHLSEPPGVLMVGVVVGFSVIGPQWQCRQVTWSAPRCIMLGLRAGTRAALAF